MNGLMTFSELHIMSGYQLLGENLSLVDNRFRAVGPWFKAAPWILIRQRQIFWPDTCHSKIAALIER